VISQNTTPLTTNSHENRRRCSYRSKICTITTRVLTVVLINKRKRRPAGHYGVRQRFV
jgi:hypothetical protein